MEQQQRNQSAVADYSALNKTGGKSGVAVRSRLFAPKING
jgi:hypothetical protein